MFLPLCDETFAGSVWLFVTRKMGHSLSGHQNCSTTHCRITFDYFFVSLTKAVFWAFLRSRQSSSDTTSTMKVVVVVLLLLQVFLLMHPALAQISFTDHGYENVIVTISPDIRPEKKTEIIDGIKVDIFK